MGDTAVHTADSKSLWNYTLSPGWTDKEIEVFVAALQKYGVGRWTRITKERILPGKTVAQMYNQCQRLLGQQSLAEFEGLRLRLKDVFEKNAKIQGDGVVRKNNCIVNQGDKQTREEVLRKKAYNKEHYGLSKEEVDAIIIPELKHEDTSSVFVNSASHALNSNPGQKRLEKIQKLKMLHKEISLIDTKIQNLKKKMSSPSYIKQKNLNSFNFYKVGDKVKADCDWEEYYPGKITKVNSDGTFNIRFDDGEEVDRVKPSQMKPSAGSKRKTNLSSNDTDPFVSENKPAKKKHKSRKKTIEKTDEEKSLELAIKLAMQADDY